MDKGFEPHIKPWGASFVVIAVEKVVYRYKANAQERKNLIQVAADLNVVPAKAREVPVRYNRNKSKNPVKSRVGGLGVILFQHYANQIQGQYPLEKKRR